jgi:hypothetical protein
MILLAALSLMACGDETDAPTGEAANAAADSPTASATPAELATEASDEAPDMVCYDMSTHTLTEDATQEDCEGKGFLWVPASSGHS